MVGAAGDLVVLDAEMAADAGLVQVRLEVFVIEVEADVAVEVAVVVVAGVALDGAPDLLGRFGVAGQGGDAALGAEDRGVDAVARPRLGEQDAVRVGEEVADAGVAQQLRRRPRRSRTPAARCPAAGGRSAARTRGSRSRSGRGTALSLTSISGRKPCVAPQVISSSLPVSKKRRKPLSRLLPYWLTKTSRRAVKRSWYIWARWWNSGCQRVRSSSLSARAMRLSRWRT